MRIGNLSGRLSMFGDTGAADVEKLSDGRYGPDPQSVYEVWDEFVGWAAATDLGDTGTFDTADLGAPTPTPRQVFAIAVNYQEHADESQLAVTELSVPPTFTKFPTSLSGPVTTVVLPRGGTVDWEVELVVVVGRRAEHVAAADAWSHVAGLTAGQDISERTVQLSGSAPQFSLGKSYPGFSPVGPWVVTLDEFCDPDDLALSCAVDGETVQDGRTSSMIFSVPALVEGLSRITPLLPGDVIFSGTPSGIGAARKPPRFLQPGEELVSHIEGIGELRQKFVS